MSITMSTAESPENITNPNPQDVDNPQNLWETFVPRKWIWENRLEALNHMNARAILVPPNDATGTELGAKYRLAGRLQLSGTSSEAGTQIMTFQGTMGQGDPSTASQSLVSSWRSMKAEIGSKLQESTITREHKKLADPTQSSQLEIPSTSPLTQLQRKRIAADSLELNIAPGARPSKATPSWKCPWRLSRVISGHTGWVLCVAVDPSNEWFATGSNDRLIKIWDLATGTLKLSLTGHINAVKSLQISERNPYMFSASDDHSVKCWDLEMNKVVRSYHGHLSGVYTCALHKSLNVLATGGRDAVVRIWDIRTKTAVHVLGGHKHTVLSLATQNDEPQFISGSQDKTVRLWDLAAGRCHAVLTNHKNAIRSITIPSFEYSFSTAAADHIKSWLCPDGTFSRNFDHYTSMLHCSAVCGDSAEDATLVAGSNIGELHFWDWKSGAKFQKIASPVQPGSLDSEAAIFAMAFDKSETRLITAECDKTIKIWKEDPDATPESHPTNWLLPIRARR